jgi:hypothetical protein
VGTRSIPTEALAFTPAFDARQFQLGLKINFQQKSLKNRSA